MRRGFKAMGFRVGIVTLSDSAYRGEREDKSGPEIEAILGEAGDFEIVEKRTLPDDLGMIRSALKEMADSHRFHLILTTGGTGLYPRDVTPEATKEVIQREVPGLPELMRMEGGKSTPKAYLSRAVAGIRGETLIVNLPGSRRAVRESLSAILPILSHALEKVMGDSTPCGSG